MATVIAVRFQKAGKLYYFDPAGIWANPGDHVIVETVRGIELGEVITSAREVPDEAIVAPLKNVLRLATEDDLRRAEANAKNEKMAFDLCLEKIAARKLEMKLISVEYTFDNSKVIFYFTANGRVDFRELVKDLAAVLKTRIELRQIGVRDEAKMLGGLGSCGRPICCGTFLGDFQPVSIKMAKEQNLSLNPTKISGQCGRLMCCLKYEQDYYEETLKKLPKVGKEVLTPDGVGNIVEINVLRERVKVKLRLSDDTFDVREYPIDDVKRVEGKAFSRPEPKKPESAPQKEKAKEAAEEPPKVARKRYPRQKAPKNLSTDQFIERERERNRQNAGAVDSEE
ncbi:MAG TPA: stage 0 sporulation family protein [Candidatus Ornithocaccomicrobium faecavium]|uniref:Stage 0 sporulation family protein n=1 Tax=Candidatus Ornithocaccomicrobium faecavium TaxID=2840890 RepID=A0A9D1PAP6_9FIRM|nr:stage 0 sporulation family protein [Candidatus Ornithocaccomicrobium faecavium]